MNKWLQLKKLYKLSYNQLELLTGIPKRTMQSWIREEREPPSYLYPLVKYWLENHSLSEIVGIDDDELSRKQLTL